MQHTTGVAVVATHLAGSDRRALSEAWYRALHLTERSARTDVRSATGGAPARDARAPHAESRRDEARPGGSRGCARRAASPGIAARLGGVETPAERRAAASEVTRRIERALLRCAPRPAPASFALTAGGGRIRLWVRSDGTRTRIVAVCAEALRGRVERALAHARFSLAGRGVHAEVG